MFVRKSATAGAIGDPTSIPTYTSAKIHDVLSLYFIGSNENKEVTFYAAGGAAASADDE